MRDAIPWIVLHIPAWKLSGILKRKKNRRLLTTVLATTLKSIGITRDPTDHSSEESLRPSAMVLPRDSLMVCGGATLSGHVHISGAKNSALAVLAGTLCSAGISALQMIPDLHDTRTMMEILRSIGVEVKRSGSEVVVNTDCIKSVEPCSDAVRKLRASFLVIGPLLARHGEAHVALPGGCNIGARPIDLHLRGLQALGAHVEIRRWETGGYVSGKSPLYGDVSNQVSGAGYASESPVLVPRGWVRVPMQPCWKGKVHAYAANGRRLVGGTFYLDYPSVGATETLMMAASLADGETTLSNVAQEPEVVDLAEYLIACGACIHGAGTSTLTIKGMKKLYGADFTIIPDRIEAGTFFIAAAITRSSLSMSPVVPRHLSSVIGKLEYMGCKIQHTGPDSLQIIPSECCRGVDMTTLPYPGFPTDLQPQFMTLLATCSGQSVVEETVFEGRMRHVEELQKLGAKIRVSRNIAIVSGNDQGSSLYGVPVEATDLRAGAALILAGMAGEGTTHINGVSHIDRGYENIDAKLRALGANIERLPRLPCDLTLQLRFELGVLR
ncbi:hypothetical protein SUGI_0752570 [Cryptomeria japonica]|nr:hypothetical protein SUGI_0752570 [Cryptomeria japonica]